LDSIVRRWMAGVIAAYPDLGQLEARVSIQLSYPRI
jgi:hypothetical protein